jgi:uroporphyrinogen-III synthase
LRPISIPTIEIGPVEAGGELDAAILRITDASWIAVTSANGGSAVLDAAARLRVDITRARWAAVGASTEAALEARGITVSFTPSTANGAALGAELPIGGGDTVLLPRADIADGRLVAALEARGARVDAVVAYRTGEAPETSRERLRALFATGNVGAIVFTSGSTVRGLLGLLGTAHQRVARRTQAYCLGEATATVALDSSFLHVVVAPVATPLELADLISDALARGLPKSAPESAPKSPQEDPA